MVKLQYALSAVKDLKSIRAYISSDSDLYARKFIEQLINKVAFLKNYPQAGRPFHIDKYNNLR